jgi:hypothetical protein
MNDILAFILALKNTSAGNGVNALIPAGTSETNQLVNELMLENAMATVPAGGLRPPVEIDTESELLILYPEATLTSDDVGLFYIVQDMDVLAPGRTGKAWANFKDGNENNPVIWYKVYDQILEELYIELTAETGTGTTVSTPAVAKSPIKAVLQLLYGLIRSAANLAGSAQSTANQANTAASNAASAASTAQTTANTARNIASLALNTFGTYVFKGYGNSIHPYEPLIEEHWYDIRVESIIDGMRERRVATVRFQDFGNTMLARTFLVFQHTISPAPWFLVEIYLNYDYSTERLILAQEYYSPTTGVGTGDNNIFLIEIIDRGGADR